MPLLAVQHNALLVVSPLFASEKRLQTGITAQVKITNEARYQDYILSGLYHYCAASLPKLIIVTAGLFETSVNIYRTAQSHSSEDTLFHVHHLSSVCLFEIRLSGYRFQ
jgi:hypothetical protein